MGLTLPAQISAPAVAALGTSWPQVDEDSVDGLAAAFDRSAAALDSHALDADRHTQGVLAASSGGLASELTHASGAIVGAADSTAATTAAQLRTAASELVADAAGIRGTKVGVIRDLSTLTERLAMLHGAGPLTAGGSSLLPAEEVDQAAQGIAHRHNQLVQALGGSDLRGSGLPRPDLPRPDLPGSDAHPLGLPDVAPAVAGLGPGVDEGKHVGEPSAGLGDPAGAPPTPTGPSHTPLGVGGLVGVSAQAAAAPDLAAPPPAAAPPATATATATGAGPVTSVAGIPAAPAFSPAGGGPVGVGHRQPPTGAGAGSLGGPALSLAGGGPTTGSGAAGPGAAGSGAAGPGAAASGAAGPGAAAVLSSTAAVARPAAAVVDGAPAPRPAADAQALVPRADDPSALLLFMAFPAGTAPVRTARPARQLPPPVREARPGLCCPPGDHPAHPDLALPLHPAPVSVAIPVEGTDLLRGWDPLGGGNERDLERRFVVRPATDGHPAEHCWPPAELHPEGAVAPDRRRPVRLEVGALLDLLGSPEGRVLAEGGTPFARRAEPAANAGRPLRQLRVAQALPAWESHLSAWFAQPGGGLRYRLTHPVADLVATGWLVDAGAGEPRGR